MNLKQIALTCSAIVLVSGHLCAVTLDKRIETAHGITFHIPQDWEPVPKDILDQATDAGQQATPGTTPTTRDYAFQRMPTDQWLTYPYVVVKVNRKGRLPDSELKKMNTIKSVMTKHAPTVESQLKPILSDICVGETVYDPLTFTVWTHVTTSKQTGGDTIDVVAGLRLTEFGNVMIMGYCTHAEFPQCGPVLEEIVKATELPEQWRYKPRSSTLIPQVADLIHDQSGRLTLIGAFFKGILIALMFAVIAMTIRMLCMLSIRKIRITPHGFRYRMPQTGAWDNLWSKRTVITCDAMKRVITLSSVTYGFRRTSQEIPFDEIDSLDYNIDEVKWLYNTWTRYVIYVYTKSKDRIAVFRILGKEEQYNQTFEFLEDILKVPLFFNSPTQIAIKAPVADMINCPSCHHSVLSKSRSCLYCE